MNNKKVIILSSIIIAVLVLTIGATYSIFSLSKVSKNSNLVVGDIYMHYNETTNSINITDMMPLTEKTYNITGVDTTVEKVNICANYLYSVYGYKSAPKNNKNEKSNIKFMTTAGSGYVIPSYNDANKYNDYCQNNLLTAYKENRLTSDDLEYLINQGVLNGTVNDNVSKLNYFEFTIDGKNTNTKNGINYNIQLVHGDVATGKAENNRIQDKFLMFKLVEVVDGNETILQNNISIENINNTTIQSEWVPENTTNEITKTYRLYMWISEDVNICSGDITENCDYNLTDWANLFASIKVNVNGKYKENDTFVSKLKARYNQETKQDGLVAVNTDGDLATSGDTIREYRYSGMGNYCTYTDGTDDYNLSVSGSTCPTNACLMNGAIINGDSDGFGGGSCTDFGGTTLNLKNNQTTSTDSGLRNYVKFNNETWRIVGIFNEENADGEKAERIKLVKDEPISLSTEVPTTITKDSITYQMFNTTSGTKYKYFYWNYPDNNYSGNLDDWTKSGSMYYLNENYLNSLENSSLIENMKYYLGNVTIKVNSDRYYVITGTNKEVYTQERGTTVCDSSITSDSHNSDCNIWNGNQVSWNGKIALLYPSDFGYASNTSNWSKDFKEAYSNGLSLNNWMFNNEMAGTWFLSPASDDPDIVAVVSTVGLLCRVNADRVDGLALRPVLSLGSQTMIISGTGSINDPYLLNAE